MRVKKIDILKYIVALQIKYRNISIIFLLVIYRYTIKIDIVFYNEL